jgi:hypothetical protein
MFRTSSRKRALFRQVNERICDVSASAGPAESYELICECGTTDCTDRVVVPADVYDGAVRNGRRYLVAPGHVLPWETVLGQGSTYAVVA